MKLHILSLAATSGVLLALAFSVLTGRAAQSQVPPPPTGLELVAGSDLSIALSWAPSAGATSYNVYRGTASDTEGVSPIATTPNTTYTDPNLSPQPVYFYRVTSVNAAGESAPSKEEASRTPPPVGTGGNMAGVPSGDATVYYAADALLEGFDWFEMQSGWFPLVLYSSGSISPGQRVVDMAYSSRGSMTFNNVVAPARGLYTISWRYAFDWGLFPGIANRQMGIRVNGETITTTQRYVITGSFDAFQQSFLQVDLQACVNSIALFAVSEHGVPRVDQMSVTPAGASVPGGPTNLTATTTPCPSGVSLSWAPSERGDPASYSVYRGSMADGEDVTPIVTTTGAVTSFLDTDVHAGASYFYAVAASNSVGISSSSNEAGLTLVC
jgi:hypothetical protein